MRRGKRGARFANRIQESLIGAGARLLVEPIECLNLPARAERRLLDVGIVRIGDLAGFQDKDLLRVDGFGLRSLRELHAAIDEAISQQGEIAELVEGDDSEPTDLEGPSQTTFQFEPAAIQFHRDDLASEWSRFLAIISERQREVVLARVGDGDGSLTLEAIGQKFDITRERVRQIQQKAMGRLQMETRVSERLSTLLDQLLSRRTSPLYLAALPAEDSWFENLRNSEPLLEFLIENLLKGRFGVFKVHGRSVVSRCLLPEWERKLETARSFVVDNASKGLVESSVQLAIEAIASAEAEELREELWQHATAYAHFAEIHGERILVAHGRGVEQMVTMVLSGSAEPLHYSVIARMIEGIYGAQEVRRVHASCEAVAYLLGRGVYGLRHHIPVSASEGKYLASLCESLVKDGPLGRQWHAREILADVEDQEPFARSLSHYELSVLLQFESDLHYVGRQVWTAKTHGRGGVHARIDVRNAIEAALEIEGRPLSAMELHKRVSVIRGLGNTFQVHPRGRLIRIGPAMWGLSDRDVSVSRDEIADAMNRLAQVLLVRSAALHVTELLATLGWSDKGAEVAWQVLGLAQVDGRFHCFSGDYLGLSGWASANRKSVHEAISAAFPALGTGASAVEVQEIVEAELQRGVSTEVVRAALRDLGASYDRLRGVWLLAEVIDREDDDAIGELL